MATFFSDFFGVEPAVIEAHGAFDISLLTDLPLFIDPFLLFNSKKPEYQALHERIISYLVFLRGKSLAGDVSRPLLKAWYCFPEFKQTWLGFSETGNDGRGLGMDFAVALNSALADLFSDFGAEQITQSSHLEKVCLIKEGVGRDNISDFTTNLIKSHLLEFTQAFALEHLGDDQRRVVAVPGVSFNYETEVWEPGSFTLPWVGGDYVVLTPRDMLTRDENWINRHDLVTGFQAIPPSVPDQQLRAQISSYFERVLVRRPNKEPTKQERALAALRTIAEFPAIIDYYIRLKEQQAPQASEISAAKVSFADQVFNENVRQLQSELSTEFYGAPNSTYEEAHARLAYLKDVIENKGGHRFFYKDGMPLQYEKDLQVMYRLVWYGTPSDVTTEANDGRGPADFKISRGANDKTIVEMKLAKNSALRRNLQHQTDVYKAASDAKSAISAVIFFTSQEEVRAQLIVADLGLSDSPDIVLIDARNDNKPSGSKAA